MEMSCRSRVILCFVQVVVMSGGVKGYNYRTVVVYYMLTHTIQPIHCVTHDTYDALTKEREEAEKDGRKKKE
jgi:mRNA-degrading endonuclease HigB of HigAB toxin-antitoxin module